MLALSKERNLRYRARPSYTNNSVGRVDSADFVGGLIIGTIGTLEVDDPLPVAAANGGCDARFP